MRPAVLAGTVASIALFAAAGTARADELTDTFSARDVAVGDAIRAGATGASARANPAGLPLTSELVFEGGYGYRAIDSTQVIQVSACDSTNAAPGCFYYDYLSSSPELDGMDMSRKEHIVGATLARMLTPRVMIGVGAKYFRFESDMPGEGKDKGFTYDIGATVRLTDTINLGAVGYNLFGDESARLPRAFAAGAQARPTPSLTASFDALWNLDRDGKDGRYGGGLEYFLMTQGGQMGYPVRLGGLYDVASDTSYVTGGLGLANLKMGIDVGGRKQLKGGDETMIVVSLRFYGPRQAPPATH